MTHHDHDDSQPCNDSCPVGPVRIHFDDNGCDHTERNVCQQCAGFTDEEVAALREYLALVAAKKPVDESGTLC